MVRVCYTAAFIAGNRRRQVHLLRFCAGEGISTDRPSPIDSFEALNDIKVAVPA